MTYATPATAKPSFAPSVIPVDDAARVHAMGDAHAARVFATSDAARPAPHAPGAPRSSRPSRSAAALALQARALAHHRFDASAAEVVNQLATLLGSERVSLGLFIHGRLRVVSMSGSADATARSGDSARIAAAMAEAIEQRAPLLYPMAARATPAITVAHRALSKAHSNVAVFTVPIATRHEMLGALLVERDGVFDRITLEAIKDAAMFVGPLLALKRRAESPVGERMARVMGPASDARPFASKRLPVVPAVAVAALIAVAAIAFVPATHHVVAPARVEGSVQQVLAAPVDGFVGAVSVRPGDAVKQGQVLLVLDTRELALERDRWAAEISQLDKTYREALSKDDAAPIVMTRAKLDAANSQYDLAQQQIDRSTLRAPIDGVVLAGDWSQAIGTPLKRGQELLTIAPDRGWRIVAEVDEQDIGHVREGQTAQAIFAATSGHGDALTFALARIAPAATALEGRNVFEVEGMPAQSGSTAAAAAHDQALPSAANTTTLRPGMRGVVRIDAGQRPLGASWWERARHALRRVTWQVLG